MDVVFYASSLNYDWGGGTNYQELKKITKWDGRQYVLVSRYALRYSILHWANKLFPDKWELAGSNELHTDKGEVVRLKDKNKEFLERIFKEFPEFDLFGFMIAEKGSEQAALTRVSPVKISHAISLTPTRLDTHTMANLDMVKRAGGKGSNPVTIEEKTDFYVYNITVDLDRTGKYLTAEHGEKNIGDIKIDDQLSKERIIQLVDTVLNLKRDIKGRREDLSPWLVILGLYENGKYETFIDKIILDKKTRYKVVRKNKPIKENGEIIGEEIENEIEEGLMPFFKISADERPNTKKPVIFYRSGFCDYEPKDKFEKVTTKKALLNKIKEFIEYKNNNIKETNNGEDSPS